MVYEDENDNYNYEKGKYATYTFTWNDKARTLTMSDTKGGYAGMPKMQKFNVVLVSDGHGTGEPVSQKTDKEVKYEGKSITVKL
jgi:alpha-D-xyloside xylohydrolase